MARETGSTSLPTRTRTRSKATSGWPWRRRSFVRAISARSFVEPGGSESSRARLGCGLVKIALGALVDQREHEIGTRERSETVGGEAADEVDELRLELDALGRRGGPRVANGAKAAAASRVEATLAVGRPTTPAGPHAGLPTQRPRAARSSAIRGFSRGQRSSRSLTHPCGPPISSACSFVSTRDDTSYHQRKLFAACGIAPLGAFLAVHIVTTASALGGESRFDRVFSHRGWTTAALFVLVVLPLAFHAGTGHSSPCGGRRRRACRAGCRGCEGRRRSRPSSSSSRT